MKIVCISDTHAQHRKIKDLPEGDIIIHAGDIMNSGYNTKEVEDFCDWYSNFTHPKKILIAGNHDRALENEHREEMEKIIASHQIIYLNNSGCVIDGINIWGSPSQIPFYGWAFNHDEEERFENFSKIPNNTDILITHQPIYGILDKVKMRGSPNRGENVGCKILKNKVLEVNPKLCIWGHIHEARGTSYLNKTLCINASVLDENYRMKNKPILLEGDKNGFKII